MLERLKHIDEGNSSLSADSIPLRPVLLERLEPRILLSGDGLLVNAAASDSRVDNMPQVIQYAELLGTSEQVEQQSPTEQEIDQDARLACLDGTNLLQPILTLSMEENTVPEDQEVRDVDIDFGDRQNEASDDASFDETAPAQAGGILTELPDESQASIETETAGAEAVHVVVEESVENNPAVPVEDGDMPEYTTDTDLGIAYSTSIEIRGPPTESGEYSSILNSDIYDKLNGFSETSEEGCLTKNKAPDLPGLQLVNPDTSNWEGQIVYLDFDGAEDVVYSGPVTVGPFDVPGFAVPAELAGQEEAIISEIKLQLDQIFSGSGVRFASEQPSSDQSYSTIYIGGDDSAFADYGLFWGLAEKVDVGNQDLSDNAFVFRENVVSDYTDLASFVTVFADVIAHETAHLLGYAH